MSNLKTQVVEWAAAKGLLTNVTPERIESQTLKVIEEIGETAGAYLKGNRENLIDGIGDIAVTIIILAAMKGEEITEATPMEVYKNQLICVTASVLLSIDYPGYLSESMCCLDKFATSQDLSLKNCLQAAYNIISKRTGKMVGDTFIKDEA